MRSRRFSKSFTQVIVLFAWFLTGVLARASEEKQPWFWGYDVARTHELKPHRRTIPLKGMTPDFHELHLMLVISSAGDVVQVEASGEPQAERAWPQVKDEVYRWKFRPFEREGHFVAAQIEEYVDLVPPERLPKHHVAAPVIQPNSKILITLQRTGCLGTCPAYTVTVSTDGIAFEGEAYVVSKGRHQDQVDSAGLRKLAKDFVDADFYSMDPCYRAGVTDSPAYILSVDIDSHKKKIVDYNGSWVEMPEIITELEDEVDTFARTERWVQGNKAIQK